MSEEVRAAVFGNVGTMVSFRVGAFDADILEKEFAPKFTAEDMVNLGFAQIYLKLMIDGVSSQPFSAQTLPPIVKSEISYKKEVIDSSRSQFARPRAEVETIIRELHASSSEEPRKDREDDNRPSPNPRPKQKIRHSEETRPQKNPFKDIVVSNEGKIEIKSEASLSELKKPINKKDHKNPSKENLNSLKEALATVISEDKKEDTSKKEDSHSDVRKEIPEDELKKVLGS